MGFVSSAFKQTIDVQRFFHRRLALGAAVLARHCHPRTNCGVHFLAFAGNICFLLNQNQDQMIPTQMLVAGKTCFCSERNTTRCWPKSGGRRVQSFDFPSLGWHFRDGIGVVDFWECRWPSLPVSESELQLAVNLRKAELSLDF